VLALMETPLLRKIWVDMIMDDMLDKQMI
jgi:hypothetical protein